MIFIIVKYLLIFLDFPHYSLYPTSSAFFSITLLFKQKHTHTHKKKKCIRNIILENVIWNQRMASNIVLRGSKGALHPRINAPSESIGTRHIQKYFRKNLLPQYLLQCPKDWGKSNLCKQFSTIHKNGQDSFSKVC